MSVEVKQVLVDGWIMVALGTPITLWFTWSWFRWPKHISGKPTGSDLFVWVLVTGLALAACGLSVTGVRRVANPAYFVGAP